MKSQRNAKRRFSFSLAKKFSIQHLFLLHLIKIYQKVHLLLLLLYSFTTFYRLFGIFSCWSWCFCNKHGQLYMKLYFAHFKGRGMTMPDQVAYKCTVLANSLGPLTIRNRGILGSNPQTLLLHTRT